MLEIKSFGNALKNLGFDFYSGVPCSFLKSLINYAINECDYIPAANEGDAVAISAGASLGGRKSVFLCQNSGLTNAVSPLTSLIYTFEIPLLGFVSLRGESGIGDEPQHELMGKITHQLLDSLQIQWQYLSDDMEKAANQIAHANEIIEQNKAFFFIVKKGTFSSLEVNNTIKKIHSEKNTRPKKEEDTQPKRSEALNILGSVREPKTILVATTGYTGRELYTIKDNPLNFYMVGSMGCANSLGLGLAYSLPHYKIIVIDGDGAILMRLGALATVGYYQPPNLFHILLDNQQHESTGGQSTVSPNINFLEVAQGLGYPETIYLHSIKELTTTLKDWYRCKKLTFAYLKTSPGTLANLGRPNITPAQAKKRLCRSIIYR